MRLGAVHMGFDAGDLLPEQSYPLLQFVDGERVQILLGQFGKEIPLSVGKQVVEVHGDADLTLHCTESMSRPS